MHCPTHAYADVVVAAPRGRIDFADAQALEAALAPALEPGSGFRGAVIDLQSVDYISSVGLRVLMVAAKSLRARKAAIAVASLQPIVAEIFEISRFHHVVDVRGTVRDAIGAISAPALAAFDAARAPEQS
jgi:anti-anti-sigma factor